MCDRINFRWRLTYCTQCPLAWRVATKALNSCLFWASFQMVPQVWFRVLISPSAVHRQVFFDVPLFHLPCGVHCRAEWVMLPASFLTKHVPNPPPLSPHDDGFHAVLMTTNKQLKMLLHFLYVAVIANSYWTIYSNH